MGDRTEDDRWNEALGRLGSEIVGTRADAQSPLGPQADFAGPEPVADASLHASPLENRETSGSHSLGYWAAIAGIAGVIAAGTGLLALLPMSMR